VLPPPQPRMIIPGGECFQRCRWPVLQPAQWLSFAEHIIRPARRACVQREEISGLTSAR
jgi:hypothetical protein